MSGDHCITNNAQEVFVNGRLDVALVDVQHEVVNDFNVVSIAMECDFVLLELLGLGLWLCLTKDFHR